jgi:hypothetical protein
LLRIRKSTPYVRLVEGMSRRTENFLAAALVLSAFVMMLIAKYHWHLI